MVTNICLAADFSPTLYDLYKIAQSFVTYRCRCGESRSGKPLS
jgi:hypothetical protein